VIGYAPEELIGQPVINFVHPDEVDDREHPFARLRSMPGATFYIERRVRHKDGSWRWVDGYSTNLLEDPAVGAIVFNYRDVTERKQAEQALRAKEEELSATTQQLWQTARLATMGELAAGIAHELNNPLAIALLRIESVLAALAPETSEHRSLEIVDAELERMRRLVANLLEFGRRGSRQVSSLNLCDEVDRSLEIMQHHMKTRNIAVQVECPPDMPLIPGDRQQLRQLFLNLFTNASDAMPSGGQLTVTLSSGGPNEQPGVTIVVVDNGVGISPEAMSRLWEPFFTTKPEGKGTGLGLPICRRIVQEHSGTIEVQSQAGRGTRVTIQLPNTSTDIAL
jgi:PAS domain S-box-containing protein